MGRFAPLLPELILSIGGTILMMVAAFCSKYEAEKVFVDKRLRKLHEFFNRDAMELVQQFL